MAILSVWGFGGVRFATSITYAQSVEFPYAKGTLSFDPVYIPRENISRKLLDKFKGYRVTCEVELTNVLITDAAKFQDLIAILNDAGETGTTVINPAYTSGASILLYYEMILRSSFSMKQIHFTECAQTLKLKFIKKELVEEIPDLVGTPDYDNLTFDDGNNMVFDNGNNAVVENN